MFANFCHLAKSANKHVLSKQHFNSDDLLAISFYPYLILYALNLKRFHDLFL